MAAVLDKDANGKIRKTGIMGVIMARKVLAGDAIEIELLAQPYKSLERISI